MLNGAVAFIVGAGDFLRLSGPISGTGGFRKLGPGAIRLSGTSHNTFDSSAALYEGILELQKTGGGIVAVPTSLIVGDGVGGADSDVVRLLANNEVGTQMAEGSFELEGLGLAGINYGIEASTNLIDWTLISTNTADGAGIFQFMDADSELYQQRFYRAVSP